MSYWINEKWTELEYFIFLDDVVRKFFYSKKTQPNSLSLTPVYP